MRRRRRLVLGRAAAWLLAVSVAAACASMPLKQRVVLSLQSAHAALAAADDLEQRTYDSGLVGGLDAERHREISVVFVRAYDAEIKATIALDAWRAGDPAPQELREYAAVARETLALVGELLPAEPASPLVEQVRKWLALVTEILSVMAAVA